MMGKSQLFHFVDSTLPCLFQLALVYNGRGTVGPVTSDGKSLLILSPNRRRLRMKE
jgi:hypothetical protein